MNRTRGMVERAVTRHGSTGSSQFDRVTEEEPLEIRVDGDPVAVTMRTPGHDHELALGFLRGEGVLEDRDDVSSVYHCGRPGETGWGNVIDVVAAPGGRLHRDVLDSARRGTLTTASCGVCGRRTIDDLLARCRAVADPTVHSTHAITAAFASMAGAQPLFEVTGGLHAAGLFRASGEALVVREDIGRHNAVDKAVGFVVRDAVTLAQGTMLLVTGRASFEIVQKAVAARVGLVASVSAASSLAIDLAARTGVCLVAFARNGTMNVYTASERIV